MCRIAEFSTHETIYDVENTLKIIEKKLRDVKYRDLIFYTYYTSIKTNGGCDLHGKEIWFLQLMEQSDYGNELWDVK